jgi:hypothetical protein
MKGKVQHNEHGVNVLVSTETSNNRHHSHLNFPVECEVLTDEQVEEAYRKEFGSPSIKDMKDKLKTVDGFAVSNCTDQKELNYQSLVSFKKF